MSKGTILVVEPDDDIRMMLKIYFSGQGYQVIVCDNYQDAFDSTRKQLPSVILTEIDLPDKSGFDLIQGWRAATRTSHIPIIVISSRNRREDKIAAIELGIDDYVTKPFDIEELKLRILNAITPAGPTRIKNPISGFPMGNLIEAHLRELMQKRDDWVYLDVKIANFEAFKAVYSWQRGDEVIKAMALFITDALELHGTENDFAGHVRSDHFVIITHCSDWKLILEMLKLQGDAIILAQASEEERQRGYVLINERESPLMSLSFGVFVAAEHPRDIDIREIFVIFNEDRKKRFGEEKKLDDGIETKW